MTTPDRATIAALIKTAADDINTDLPPGIRLRFADEAVLIGPNREIDSLGLIMLLAAIEGQITARFGRTLLLGQEEGDQDGARFSTLGRLIDYVTQRLGQMP